MCMNNACTYYNGDGSLNNCTEDPFACQSFADGRKCSCPVTTCSCVGVLHDSTGFAVPVSWVCTEQITQAAATIVPSLVPDSINKTSDASVLGASFAIAVLGALAKL